MREKSVSENRVNAEGQTESEFLASYDPGKWRHPALTADCILFAGNEVLLVRRGNHPDIGRLAFPGGFVEPGESAEHAAERELAEETGARCPPVRQLATASTPGRDPRDWVVTVCFYGACERFPVKAGDDAASAAWYGYSVSYDGDAALIALELGGERETASVKVRRNSFGEVDINLSSASGCMAFDHAKTFLLAYERLKKENKLN